MEFLGRQGDTVLLSFGDVAVVVDESTNIVVDSGTPEVLLASASWDANASAPSDISVELATASITSLDIEVLSDSDRMYTIPKAAVAEAKRGLAWRKEHKRGGTSVGLNTARTLARGGQIGLRKVRHIAKYFPRHEVDKRAKGYSPGEDGYPSKGRIAWALWGGDSAWRWAADIVERENNKSASIYEDYQPLETFNLSAFTASGGKDATHEFYIRLYADGSGFDRLYLRDSQGVLSVWEKGDFFDLGEEFVEFASLDNALDEVLPHAQVVHVPVDSEAALLASALLDNSPSGRAFVAELDFNEAFLAAASVPYLDLDELDGVLVAAPRPPALTPELKKQRAAQASQQSRDALGRFAETGSTVNVKGYGNKKGVIQSINNNQAQVNFEDGSNATVPVNQTYDPTKGTPKDVASPASPNAVPAADVPAKMYSGGPLDVSGILAEPREVFLEPGAQLPAGSLPPLTSADINTLLNDWPAWVQAQRDSFVPMDIPQIRVTPDSEQYKAPNAYNDPFLRKWLDKKVKKKDGSYHYPNRFWYQPSPGGDVEKKLPAKQVGTVKPPKQKVAPSGSSTTSERKWSWDYVWKNGRKYKRRKWSNKTITSAASPNVALNPKTSDVPPIYMAVVSPDDPQAVMDLISLIPASSQSTQPAVFAYKDGDWTPDDGMLRDLQSATPPPVVVLDDEGLKSVLNQMDSAGGGGEPKPEESGEAMNASVEAALAVLWAEAGMVAAGGLDRNRGNAEELRRYWTVGKGGLKIRWGTPGDWTRCVRQLSKYLGPRAKGYCALRHKEMTGLWTGDKAHRQMFGRMGNGVFAMSDDMILSSDAVVDALVLRARRSEAVNRVITASGGFQSPVESMEGAKFFMPLVVPEGVETGDGRKFSKGAITMRELPLPLMWQIKTDEGHYGSVVVGRIDHMERNYDGIGNAYGVFDMGEYGKEAERLVRGGFIRGISADLDKFEADEDPEDAANKDKKSQGKILISKARVMGVTLVPKPAFQECTIELVKEPELDDKEYDALVACAAIAASIPVVPPRSWFDDPKLAGPTPLTVSEDGRVFGHIAAWHVDHIGLSFGTKPPRSNSGYAYFHTGVLRCDDGKDVAVGQLTLAGGHASLSADARSAAKHYDDTGSAFADVHAGEDAYGIWVAGALRPEVSPQQVRAIRASAPSGDWRPIGGNLELVAVCQVNVPGFPIARARVASGEMYALVAAGASYLARLKENPELDVAADDAKSRFSAIKSDLDKSRRYALVAGGGCGCCAACKVGCMGSCCDMCIMSDMPIEPVYMAALKALLADVVGFSFRAQGYHWNVVGEDFSEYHKLFGKIYEDAQESIDPLAENIRKLGGFPPVSLKDFAEKCSLAGTELEAGSPRALAADLLMANEALVEELKSLFSLMEAANEQGVCDFIAGRIDAHQKWSWQLSSSIMEKEIIVAENDDRGIVFEAVFADLESQGLVASSGEFGDFAYISQDIRERAAEKGQALPDGSFPIRNVKDLKNAVRAYGRAKASKRAAVRKHIIKRAKQLKRPDLIPDTFKSASIEAEELSAVKVELSSRVRAPELAAKAAELSARVKSLTAAADVVDEVVPAEPTKVDDADPKFTAKTQPRDAQGRFRQVLARLKKDLGAASLARLADKIQTAQNLDNVGDYSAAAAGAADVIGLVDRLDSGALNAEALTNVRLSATALAESIANLPLPFKNQAQKIRYSDVPPALQKLMDDMIDKVAAKIGADDAKIATEKLEAFRSGSEVFSQGEISGEMNRLLRLLT